jgi:ribonuclease BN (tRNA processing enzyme)
MKITVLGTSAGYAGKNQGCSAYLLSTGELTFLVDCGPGTVAYLQNFVDIHSLSGILLSHLHADHISDLFTLRYALHTAFQDGLISSPLPLYLPRTPGLTCRYILESIGEELEPVFIDQGSHLHLGEAEVRFLKTSHPLEAYAMRFQEKTAAVYTADTGYFPGLATFARGTALLLSEATLQDKDSGLQEKMGHMTARTAGSLATEASAGQLVLTHLWPPDDPELSLAQAREEFGGDIRLAHRGDSWQL